MATNSKSVHSQTNLNQRLYKHRKKVMPTLESLSEISALNNEDSLHPTSFKTIMRFQQNDKPLIEITKETPNDYDIKQFHGTGKTHR